MNKPEPVVHLQGHVSTDADTHSVFNQAPPLANFNAFDTDTALKQAVQREGAAWALPQLSAYGARTGGAEAIQWGFDANEYKPQFFSHDGQGFRVDLVKYHDSYHRLMAMALDSGIHAGPWTTPRAGAHVARAAQSYLQSQVDAGHGCPLTMTFASVPALQTTPALARGVVAENPGQRLRPAQSAAHARSRR